ncbi:MAG: TolC family protein [candidate division Zixibacteria bacterium]|nr:TolC family protein [candidate division Zixibacteria bacterium]MBU1471656.1 TolC family protein [candidate division Zixibacteria bacterium]MBU2626302.1 TolC family protein [candidate division Zixibacteria bacterium]
MNRSLLNKHYLFGSVILLLAIAIVVPALSYAEMLTLDDAIDIAVNRTARGGMIRGNLEVAEQNYFARKINFYVPEISINGSVPAYNVDESYRFFGGATEKQLYRTRDLGFNSFVELNQSLITGGDVKVTANLLTRDDRYPNTRPGSELGSFIKEHTNQGYFTFRYEQPILKPSDSKNNLYNTRDDLEIAKMVRLEEETALRKEITEAYITVLQLSIKSEITNDKFEAAGLTAEIDSMKLIDGVISEEDWLLSSSNRLDAELESFEIENQVEEQRRELAILLDRDPTAELELTQPTVSEKIDKYVRQRMLDSWEISVPVIKADMEYSKAERQANYAASGHGINGDLTAEYSTGQGRVETDGISDNINTKGWGVALNFSFPIWDGGASGAAVKSAWLGAEQSKLESDRARKRTKAEIINLVNQLDVGYRRLEIVRQQIDLAENKLNIAESRFNDGQISKVTYLESKVFYLETRDRYLEELKSYVLNKIELEGKFIDG